MVGEESCILWERKKQKRVRKKVAVVRLAQARQTASTPQEPRVWLPTSAATIL